MAQGLGLVRQLPDIRDYKFTAKEPHATLPTSVDLRTSPARPPIWDQGQLGSCTAFASGRLQYFTYVKDGFHNPFEPSHLFQYYNSRFLENTVASDSGATIRDAIKAGVLYGMCGAHWFPYDITQFTVKPPADAYLNAAKHKTVTYHAVAPTDIRACLAEGFPVEYGISVYSSFYDAGTNGGLVPMPAVGEALEGGHAIAVMGYDDTREVYIVDNSWSADWGDKGSCYIPYAYLTDSNLSFDGWTLRTQK